RVVHSLILQSRNMKRKSGLQYSRWPRQEQPRNRPRERRSTMARTMAEKVWQEHVVRRADGEPDLLYIDLHLVHEVTSPQAFEGLRMAGRSVRRPDLTIATEDHNVPTQNLLAPIADPVSRKQVETLRKNCSDFGVRLH